MGMSEAAAGTDDASYVSVNESFRPFMNGQSVCKMNDISREALLAHALSTGAISELLRVEVTQLGGGAIVVFPAKNSTVGTVKDLVAESEGVARVAQTLWDSHGVTRGDCDKPLADDARIGASCTLTLVVNDTPQFAWDSDAEMLQNDRYRLLDPYRVKKNFYNYGHNWSIVPIVPIMVVPEDDGAPDEVHKVSFRVSDRLESTLRGRRGHTSVHFGLARVGHYSVDQEIGFDRDDRDDCYNLTLVGMKWCFHETPLQNHDCNPAWSIPHGTVFTLVFDPTKGTLHFLHDGVSRSCIRVRDVGKFCVPGQQLQWVVSVPGPDTVVEIVPNVCI
jgi:hypothetical protein